MCFAPLRRFRPGGALNTHVPIQFPASKTREYETPRRQSDRQGVLVSRMSSHASVSHSQWGYWTITTLQFADGGFVDIML